MLRWAIFLTTNPLAHIARIPVWWLRCPLLALWAPVQFTMVALDLLIVGDLFDAEKWMFGFMAYLAAIDGAFVGAPYASAPWRKA